MATINLGNIINLNGTAFTSGVASGLDSNAIIEQLVEAKSVPITRLEDEITLNNSKSTAYGELRTVLDSFRTAADFLRNPPGFSSASNNLFEYRSTTLTASSSALTASSYLSATAAAGTNLGDYDVAIGALAKSLIQRSNAFTTRNGSVTEAAGGTTAGLFSAGTFEFITSQKLTTSTQGIAYGSAGAGDGVLIDAATPITTTTGGSNPNALQGGVASVSAAIDGADQVDITITLDNGEVYKADNVPSNAGGDGQSIAAGSILFTNVADGGSFTVLQIADYNINNVPANATAYAGALQAALANVEFLQTRSVTGLDTVEFTGSALEGLSSSDITFTGESFDSANSPGLIGKFEVTGVSGAGAGDGSITVVIDGETYQATGLGGEAGDVEENDIVLQSLTSNRSLSINISNETLSVAFDTDGAAALEQTLNDLFPVKVGAVTLEEGDSLNDIESKINAVSGDSDVTASIVQVGANDFRLVLQSENEGTENAYTLLDPDGVLTQVTLNTTQAAQDAEITVNGITVTRSGNVVDDVIEGLTLQLLAVTPDYGLPGEESINVAITEDVDTVEDAIVNFIDAYNEFRVFLARQSERDEEGELVETAILDNDANLRLIENLLNAELSRVVENTSDPAFRRLSDLGISFTDFAGDEENDIPPTDNILTYDPTELRNKLVANFQEVREIFEFTFNADSDDINVLSRTNDLSLTEFTLDIDLTRAAGDQVRVLDSVGTLLFNADIEQNSAGFYEITGQEDTDLEGLTLLYTGGDTASIDVSLSAGLADRFYNLLEDTLDENDGLVQNAVDALDDSNEFLEDDIERIEDIIERFRERLFEQFNALEEAIGRVNTLLEFLTAQADAIAANS